MHISKQIQRGTTGQRQFFEKQFFKQHQGGNQRAGAGGTNGGENLSGDFRYSVRTL